jgi:hypothetical protein
MDRYKRIIDITSSSNPAVKIWKSLLGSRGIKKNGLTIVSGSRIIEDILQHRPDIIDAYLIHGRTMDEIHALPPGVTVYRLEVTLYRELDIFGTDYPLLVVKVPDIPQYEKTIKTPPLLLLVPFKDPSNVGAVIRSAVAFDLTTILLLEEAASPYHPRRTLWPAAHPGSLDSIWKSNRTDSSSRCGRPRTFPSTRNSSRDKLAGSRSCITAWPTTQAHPRPMRNAPTMRASPRRVKIHAAMGSRQRLSQQGGKPGSNWTRQTPASTATATDRPRGGGEGRRLTAQSDQRGLTGAGQFRIL